MNSFSTWLTSFHSLKVLFEICCFWRYYRYTDIFNCIFLFFKTYDDSKVGIWEMGLTMNTTCVLCFLLHYCMESYNWVSIYFSVNNYQNTWIEDLNFTKKETFLQTFSSVVVESWTNGHLADIQSFVHGTSKGQVLHIIYPQ